MYRKKVGSAKILLVTSNFPPVIGGSSVVYHNLALCGAGNIDVLTARVDYKDGSALSCKGDAIYNPARVRRLKRVRSPLKGHPSALYRVIVQDFALRLSILTVVLWRRFFCDLEVVCIGEIRSLGWLASLSRRLGLRVIIYTHGEEITQSMNRPDDLRSLRHSARYADRVIAVSNFTREVLQDRLAVDSERIVLIKNGVDLGRFEPRGKRQDLLDRYGCAGRPVIVTVARLVERKGIDKTLEALPLVVKAIPDIFYLVVGSGPMEKELKALAATLGVSERVRFCGAVSDEELVDHYCLGDVFCMPNRELANGDTEGFGLVFLEANAVGLPVVSGVDGGVPDAVQDGKNGLCVDGNDVHQIAAAIIDLLTNEDRRLQMQAAGLEMVAKCSWEKRAGEFMTACQGLVKQNNRHSEPAGSAHGR